MSHIREIIGISGNGPLGRIFTDGTYEVKVFDPLPGQGFPGTQLGDAQVDVDGDWDEVDCWDPERLRSVAALYSRAADYTELVRRGY